MSNDLLKECPELVVVRRKNGLVHTRIKRPSPHGHAVPGKHSITYNTWQTMLARCRYPKRDKNNKHINRGISVCERWLSFENFLADMGERPEGTSIDRINNNGNYEPSNCRWATPVEQARNRRTTRLNFESACQIAFRMFQGESAKELAKEFNVSESLPREIYKGRTWKDAREKAATHFKLLDSPPETEE